MQGFRRLAVWTKAHELTLRIYTLVDQPAWRHRALAAQLCRSAHSIPANIAEGSGRSTAAQFANALQIAIGSARELDYFLTLTHDVGAMSSREHATLEARTEEVTKMLVGLHARIRRVAKGKTPVRQIKRTGVAAQE